MMSKVQIHQAAKQIFEMRGVPVPGKAESSLQERKATRKKLEQVKFESALRQIMRDYQFADSF